MIGYVTIGTSDMAKACAFYDELLAGVGGKQLFGMDRIKFYASGNAGGMLAVCIPYDEQDQHCGNGNMVAIACEDSAQIKAMYDKAIALGATDEGEPGERVPGMFEGAYVRDLDGNKLCFYKMNAG